MIFNSESEIITIGNQETNLKVPNTITPHAFPSQKSSSLSKNENQAKNSK